MDMKRIGIILMIVVTMGLLAGCGDKADLTILMMPGPQQVIPTEVTDQVKAQLQQQLGSEKKIEVNASAMYSIQKLIAELAVGTNDLIVLPEDDMKNFAKNSGTTPLEDIFDKEKYKRGFVEGTVFVKDASGKEQEKKEEHLYALPIHDMKMFKSIGFALENLFVIIPSNAPHPELAKEVLKSMAE